MKRLVLLATLAILGIAGTATWAQEKPKLVRMTFRVNNQTVTCTGNAKVSMTLIFDSAMDVKVFPQVNFGLQAPYPLELPMVDREWVDEITFFASFDINEDVPSTGDGLYKFLVSAARGAGEGGLVMNETLSDTVVNSRGETSNLSIDRIGNAAASTDSVGFGSIRAGTVRDSVITVQNDGCANITITGYSLNANSRPFSLIESPTNVVLGGGDVLRLTVRFNPSNRRSYQNQLKIFFRNQTQKLDSLSVKLTGSASGARIVVIPGDSVRFGTVQVNTARTNSVQVTNDTTGAKEFSETLEINSISTSDGVIFEVDTKSLSLAPGDTKTVNVTFKPNTVKAYSGNLIFATNDFTRGNGQLRLPMSGTASPTPQPPPPITQLNIDWGLYGGYPGYAFSDTLYICLPNNIAGVAFARWKIVTNDAPPQSANDFTGGAVPFVSGNTLCFKIPLRGWVTSNVRNYCYVWLDGTNGTSGWQNYFYSPLYYYTGVPVLTNLNINLAYWPGGYAYYTRLGSIPICWDVQDGRDVAEVRWKIVSNPNPPNGAADTTNGGRFRLATNGTLTSLGCADLRLNKLTRQGWWYVYVWVLDKAGNSGHASATSFRFNYDVTAPSRPTQNIDGPITRNIPVNTWFGRDQILRFAFRLPTAARDAARVFWRFKTAPDTLNGAQGQSALTFTANRDSVRFSVDFNSSDLCGEDSLYFWVADSAGNVNPANYSLARYRFDMCPPEITRVKTLSNNIALNGQDFVDRLLVTDPHSDVDTVWVNYRLGGATTEAPPIPAFRIGTTDTFRFTIPLAGVTRRGLEFRATARDNVPAAYNGPNTANGPSNGPACNDHDGDAMIAGISEGEEMWYPIRTRVTGEGDFRIDSDGRPVPLASGDSTLSYQLVSVPYELDSSGVLSVVQDDLGAADAKQWRLFDYLPQNSVATRWQEGAKARAFTPGRAFFVITRKNDVVLDSGPGQTRRTVCPDTLTVYEGWNLLATPFNFPVHKRSLRLINADKDTVSLWSFERQWTFSDVMDPWRGYAIYVTRGPNVSTSAPLRLIVQPVAVPGRIGKPGAPALAWQSGEWAVQIAAQANEARDKLNWAGVRRGSAEGYDANEMAEPPVIGGYVSVSFPRPEWRQPAENFCTDFRAQREENQVWEFEVATDQTRSDVRVQFDFVGDFPADAKVYVIDEALGIAQDLRVKTEYTFRSGAQPIQKKLKLVVGAQEFVAKQAGEIALVPQAFELLQNFPNPFNPETSMRYNLPEAAAVSLVIYDQLGRKVRTLLNGVSQPAGYHSVLWDGRDETGRAVATGIYLYKITAGAQSQVRKMVLQK